MLRLGGVLEDMAGGVTRVGAVRLLKPTAAVEPVPNRARYSLRQREKERRSSRQIDKHQAVCKRRGRGCVLIYFVSEHRGTGREPYLLYLGLAVREARVYEQPSGG